MTYGHSASRFPPPARGDDEPATANTSSGRDNTHSRSQVVEGSRHHSIVDNLRPKEFVPADQVPSRSVRRDGGIN